MVGIALALVEPDAAAADNELQVGVRNRRMRARVVRPPFVK
jgi:glycine cleavage system aminomethyltransferase T